MVDRENFNEKFVVRQPGLHTSNQMLPFLSILGLLQQQTY